MHAYGTTTTTIMVVIDISDTDRYRKQLSVSLLGTIRLLGNALRGGSTLGPGGGGTGPPNVGQPPNILVTTAKIRILKI